MGVPFQGTPVGGPAPELVPALLDWYQRESRPLPWREDPSPYHVLVSEFMLQQTQVATAIPYYLRFIRRFPGFEALAGASEDEVLRLWEGLGYYRRARHLHQLARKVVADYQGRLPQRVEELRELPGVGPYTAGAVASIAFGQPVPALDGNIRRVLARLANLQEPVDRAEGAQALERVAAQLMAQVPPGSPGDFNQALMELGALLCRPRVPQCGRCPVAAWCGARQAGNEERLPLRAARLPKPLLVHVVAFVLLAHAGGAGGEAPWEARPWPGRVLLVKRPRDTLLGGMWCLPWVEGELPGGPGEAGPAAWLGPGWRLREEPLAEMEHAFTHRRWRLRATGVVVPPGTGLEGAAERFLHRIGFAAADACWADGDERDALGLARPFRKILEAGEGRAAGAPGRRG